MESLKFEGMIAQLEEWDHRLFFFLNGLHQPWLDQPMYFMTKGIFWLPVYLAIAYLVIKAYNVKILVWALLATAVVVTLGDRSSVELFKEVFQRFRPSHHLEYGQMVHLVNDYRGGLYSFVSSHATNFFGIATFYCALLLPTYPRIAPWLLVWAAWISYTRIYLGVHYPSDILGGAVLGSLIGYIVYLVFTRLVLSKYTFVRDA